MKKWLIIVFLVLMLFTPYATKTQAENENKVGANIAFVSMHLSERYFVDGREYRYWEDSKLDLKVQTFVYNNGDLSIVVIYNGVLVAAVDRADTFIFHKRRWMGRLEVVVNQAINRY